MKGGKEERKIKKVISHLKEDKKEYKDMSKDDSKLMKTLRKPTAKLKDKK